MSAEDVWKPFGIELGKELANDFEILNESITCPVSSEIDIFALKLKCYHTKVNNNVFALDTWVTVNDGDVISNYPKGAVISIKSFKTGTNNNFDLCYQRVIDMKNSAINKYNFVFDKEIDIGFEIIDKKTKLIVEKDKHYSWKGKRNNINFRTGCSRSYDGSSKLSWSLNDIKLNTGVDDI